MNTEMDVYRQVAPVIMLILIGVFFWRDRAYLDEPDRDKLYHASMLLCLSQVKAFAVLIVLGLLGILVYAIGLVAGFWQL
ncbi:hypothetical protein [Stieleria maiorica]|nr:hypothetical protein [Stieleria maiorica]